MLNRTISFSLNIELAMRSCIVLITFFFLISPTYTWGQVGISTNRKAQKLYSEAQSLVRSYKYDQAIEKLKAAIATDSKFASAMQQLGDIYRKTNQHRLAIPYYEQILVIAPTLTSLTYFALGESYLYTGEYEKAKKQLTKYYNTARLSDKSKKLVIKYLQDCDFAMNHVMDTSISKVTRLGKEINTLDNEYFPKLTADNKTIIFTRKVNNIESFYESHKENGVWKQASLLEGEVNSYNFNEGAHCISPDGKYLFFTGCNWTGGLGSCDIYVSKKENGVWTTPYNLGPPINTSGWESQPAISADGRTLYFVSNRSGGYGGNDIWKSELTDKGVWSKPVNLGGQINTPFDESAPYIHADNKTLYFASTGWPGFGQNDIFVSTLTDTQEWSEPINMGPIINDFKNQTSFHISLNGKIAHLSTEDDKGQLDIYEIRLPPAQWAKRVAFIEGIVTDSEHDTPLNSQVSITDTETGKKVFQDDSDPIDGSFLATLPIGHLYAIHVHQTGYVFETREYDLRDTFAIDEKYTEHFELSPIRKGISTILNNIYFDVDQSNILPESEPDLLLLANFLLENPNVSIEIQGHTDNTGSTSHNLALSQKRAKSVSDYLIERGISDSRIRSKGYGDSLPIANNDNEAGRKLNRRTTFEILQH